MNPWAYRRKGLIFGAVVLALVIIVGVPSYFALQDRPDCQNRKQDGDETGVDCGGSCQLLCTPETLPLISRGDVRLLKVATTTYEAVILVENPNVNGVVERAPYTISIYSGAERTPVKVFERETYIGRNSLFALFEGPFELPGPGPYRAVFAWGGDLKWEKSDESRPIIGVENMNLIASSGSAPRLEARLVNRSSGDISNIEAVALLSDASGNIVASGKTFVDYLPAEESAPIVFSWPFPLPGNPVSMRIIPHVLPDKSYLR